MNSDSITYLLVKTVAEQKGTDPETLTPLHTVIDPDALETLFDDTTGSTLQSGHVTFEYEGFTVRLYSDRSIELDPADL